MRFFPILLFVIFSLEGFSQSLATLQDALLAKNKKIQAIHSYPFKVKDGDCHWVDVVSIVVRDGSIVIIENWTDWKGGTATTTLTGTLKNDIAEGTWVSSFSSGTWSYNFKTNQGRWNKLKTIPLFQKTFTQFEPLMFHVVASDQIKDGFYPCSK